MEVTDKLQPVPQPGEILVMRGRGLLLGICEVIGRNRYSEHTQYIQVRDARGKKHVLEPDQEHFIRWSAQYSLDIPTPTNREAG